MARKRVFLDECNSDLRHVFGPKDHVYTARSLGIAGKEDTRVIDEAIKCKCLIITVNKDFVQYYRDHPMRKGKRSTYGYGLIFLKRSKRLTREKQLRSAIKALEWADTRGHDDLAVVSAEGKTRMERLCHRECAAEFPEDQTAWG
ncbi:MAG: DUF5615 family PIN-like protein [Terriglobales bacterium]